MTVLSRGARGRRGGRRPGWVLLTALLVLAIGASSVLVFTDRVELLRLAVILALWAAVAGAFVSVLYRRQSDADQSRVRDLKLVYDLQLDREISARREYELTVESQLRRELASELRALAADDLAALQAELSALRNSLEILFDTDLQHRPALETPETEAPPERAYGEWDRNGESPRAAPVDWVSSDRVTSVLSDHPPGRADETAIIDVPEEPLSPPRQPPSRERVRFAPGWPQEPAEYVPTTRPRFETRHQPPPAAAPPGAPAAEPVGRRRSRHSDSDEPADGAPVGSPPPYADTGRRSRSRHSAEYRDYGVRNFAAGESTNEPVRQPPVLPPVVAPAAAPPAPPRTPDLLGAEPAPPQMASPPNPRHRGADRESAGAEKGPETGGQSVAELLARLQVEPSAGGWRRRRDD